MERLQSHVRNVRGILFLLNKLLVKKESFSRSLSGNPIPDGDMFSLQTFCRCLLLSFECQLLEGDGKYFFFPSMLLQISDFKLKVPFPMFWLNLAQKVMFCLQLVPSIVGTGKIHFQLS